MSLARLLEDSKLILTEGSVLERLRRFPDVQLDPYTAHAPLIYKPKSQELLRSIYREYLDIAVTSGLPMLLATPTWRASSERLQKAGLMRDVNGDSVRLLTRFREEYDSQQSRVLIGGLMACKGDAYSAQDALPQEEAQEFHSYQVEKLAGGGCDFLQAQTLPALSEAKGIALAMADTGVPYMLSFVIRRDGSLLDGTPLPQAVESIDQLAPPLCYMVNCVHPTVLESALDRQVANADWLTRRLLGIQANTSTRSPEELDNLPNLDTEEPEPFAASLLQLHKRFGMRILGGCCGTDARHIQALANMDH